MRAVQVCGFWEAPHGAALLNPHADRPQTAAALFARGAWLHSGGFLLDEAFASYALAAMLLEAESRSGTQRSA